MVKNPPAMWETWVWSLGWENPMNKETATHSSILTWRISWTEEPGRLQFMGSQRVRHTLGLHDPDNHDGVITHLEPDILECQVKWALGSITMNKASGGDGIPVELFRILKDEAVKVLHSICQQIWKWSSGPRTGKGQFSFQSQRKAMPKNAQATAQLHLSHTLAN